MGQALKRIAVPVRYTVITLTFLIFAVLYWSKTHKFVSCSEVKTLLYRDEVGHSVFYIRDFCDGIASSDTESLDLTLPSGARTTILRFDYPDHSKNKDDFEAIQVTDSHQPKVRRTDSHTLSVEIGVVGNIQSKIENVGDTRIVFNIHRVVVE
jgi:hypothetical protein